MYQSLDYHNGKEAHQQTNGRTDGRTDKLTDRQTDRCSEVSDEVKSCLPIWRSMNQLGSHPN